MYRFSDDLYKTLKKAGRTGLHWYCSSCNGAGIKVLADVKLLKERVTKMESRHEDLCAEVTALREEIIELRKKKQKGESDTVWDELKVEVHELKKSHASVTAANGCNAGIVVQSVGRVEVKTVQSEVHKALDREKRKSNLVLFGLDEKMTDDEAKVKIGEILKCTGASESVEVKFMGRIGKAGGQVVCRPYRIVIDDADSRRLILRGGK